MFFTGLTVVINLEPTENDHSRDEKEGEAKEHIADLLNKGTYSNYFNTLDFKFHVVKQGESLDGTRQVIDLKLLSESVVIQPASMERLLSRPIESFSWS